MNTIIRYVLLAAVVCMLGGLTGWYFFLRGQAKAVQTEDQSRGFATAAPFGAPAGSTYENMSGGFGISRTGPRTLTQLWHVDPSPVAGFAFVSSGASSTLSYVETGNGYVFTADPATQTFERDTNTLNPKIHEAYFGDGGHVIERYIDENGAIATFAGTVSTSSETVGTSTVTALKGTQLTKNILAMAVEPRTSAIIMLVPSPTGIKALRTAWGSTASSTLFTSAIADWRLMWLSDQRLFALEKPADGMGGYVYAIGQDGSFTPVLRNLPGLTFAPRASSTAMLYGISTGSGLYIYGMTDQNSSAVLLPLHTTADKCVWGTGKDLTAYCAVPIAAPTGSFLDDWYKGAVHTVDTWWRVEVSAGTAQLFYTPSANAPLDVHDPAIDPSGSYIAFRNGYDDSLWMLRINK